MIKIILFIVLSKILYEVYLMNIPYLLVDRFMKHNSYWDKISTDELFRQLECKKNYSNINLNEKKCISKNVLSYINNHEYINVTTYDDNYKIFKCFRCGNTKKIEYDKMK